MAYPARAVDLFIVGPDFYRGSTHGRLKDGWCDFQTLGQRKVAEYFGSFRELGGIYYISDLVPRGALRAFEEHRRQTLWLGRQGANVARIIIDPRQKTGQHATPVPGNALRCQTEQEAISALGKTAPAPDAMVISAEHERPTPLVSFLTERYGNQLIPVVPPDFEMRDSGSVHLRSEDLAEAQLPDNPCTSQTSWDTYNRSRGRGILAGRWYERAFLELHKYVRGQLNKTLCWDPLRWRELALHDGDTLKHVKRQVARYLGSGCIQIDNRVLAEDDGCIDFIARKLIDTITNEIFVEVVPHAPDLVPKSQDLAELYPQNWAEMLKTAARRFSLRVLARDILSRLQRYPFHVSIKNRVFELFGVLQEIAFETRDDSSLTKRGGALRQQHFVGERAWFTNESKSNERRFQHELTFADPTSGRPLFCPWHGKINVDQFRMHFEWPRPQGQRVIKVVYVGPKITRH
jgi:hypothetical protein